MKFFIHAENKKTKLLKKKKKKTLKKEKKCVITPIIFDKDLFNFVSSELKLIYIFN